MKTAAIPSENPSAERHQYQTFACGNHSGRPCNNKWLTEHSTQKTCRRPGCGASSTRVATGQAQATAERDHVTGGSSPITMSKTQTHSLNRRVRYLSIAGALLLLAFAFVSVRPTPPPETLTIKVIPYSPQPRRVQKVPRPQSLIPRFPTIKPSLRITCSVRWDGNLRVP